MLLTGKSRSLLLIAIAIALLLPTSNAGYQLGASRIIQKMELVADWELAHPGSRSVPLKRDAEDPLGWALGVFYTGLTALADRSSNTKYADTIFAVGNHESWRLGPNPFSADDNEFAQNWIWAYNRNHDPAMIAAVHQRFDTIIAANPSGSLRMPPPGSFQECSQRWCWIDALFMGPPAWTALSRATHDPKYLAYADKEYRATAALLFDKTDSLFYEDSSFIGKTGGDGEKIFWSRGNGWVYAGLARVLSELPPQSPSRDMYEALYLAMSQRLILLQKANGSWAPSLLDPRPDTPLETSGTGFFTYGLAWGIKTGLLTDPVYRRAADRGWSALIGAVRPNGKLGWVQEQGNAPDTVSAKDTQPFGAGAFLLAGSAMHDIAIER